MNIYIFAEHDELEDFASELSTAIAEWSAPKTTINAIYRVEGETEDAVQSKNRVIEVGVEMSISNGSKLKDPLNTLYKLAQTYKCEFVIGQIEDSGYQDVCYFGYEEGRPDMYEIANYLGL